MAYIFVPFPMTLDDLEGHLPNAGLIKCNSTNICGTRCVARSLGDSGASCSCKTDMTMFITYEIGICLLQMLDKFML